MVATAAAAAVAEASPVVLVGGAAGAAAIAGLGKCGDDHRQRVMIYIYTLWLFNIAMV